MNYDTIVVDCSQDVIEEIMDEFIKKLSVRNEISDINVEEHTVFLYDDVLVKFGDDTTDDGRYKFCIGHGFRHGKLENIACNYIEEGSKGNKIVVLYMTFKDILESYEPGTSFYYHLDQQVHKNQKHTEEVLDAYLKSFGLTMKSVYDMYTNHIPK